MGKLSVLGWVRQALTEARSSRYAFASTHVDRLDIAGGVSTGMAASLLLSRAMAGLRDIGATGAARLAVPIGMIAKLEAAPPQVLVWPSAVDEPPSLYYFEPRFWLLPSDREEYRCPCDLVELHGLGLNAEYVCGRSVTERSQGWEFSKTIWLSSTRTQADPFSTPVKPCT